VVPVGNHEVDLLLCFVFRLDDYHADASIRIHRLVVRMIPECTGFVHCELVDVGGSVLDRAVDVGVPVHPGGRELAHAVPVHEQLLRRQLVVHCDFEGVALGGGQGGARVLVVDKDDGFGEPIGRRNLAPVGEVVRDDGALYMLQ
jgi:hypothetical protein